MNVDAVVTRASRDVVATEEDIVRRLRAYLAEAERRLLRDLRVGFPRSLPENRPLREARARAHLAQVQTALMTLRLDLPENQVLDLMREAVRAGRDLAKKQTDAVLDGFAERRPDMQPVVERLKGAMNNAVIDLAAVEAQVRNSEARLHRHSVEAIEKINASVVNGLVRGFGFQKVSRELRDIITGPPGVHGGLAFHAESIARTELLSSLNDAREERYREADIEKVVWIATDDERVCPYCAARSGLLYALDDIVIPAHVRCRCTSVPFKDEWVEDGLVDPQDFVRHRKDVQAAFNAAHADDGVGMATGPTPFERANGVPQPTALPMPGIKPLAGDDWRPLPEEEAIAALTRLSGNLVVTQDTELALGMYAGFGSMRIDEGLIGGYIVPEEGRSRPFNPQDLENTVKLIDTAMNLTELQEPVTLWYAHAARGPFDDLDDLVGTYVTEATFLRASAREEVGREYANDMLATRGPNDTSGYAEVYLMKIRAREGTHAVPIMALEGADQDEAEVLLPRNTPLRIIGARRNADGVIEVEVEIGRPPSRRSDGTNPYLTEAAMATLYADVTARLGADADMPVLREFLRERGVPLGDGFEGRPVGFMNTRIDDLHPTISRDIAVGVARYEQMFDSPTLPELMSRGVDMQDMIMEPGTVAHVERYSNTGERIMRFNASNVPNTDEDAYLEFARLRKDLQAHDHAAVREANAIQASLPPAPVSHNVVWEDHPGTTSMIHEMGHHAHWAVEDELRKRAFDDPNWSVERHGFTRMWSALTLADGPSLYSRTNKYEAFAEAWTQMLVHPEDVWSPSTKVLADWLRDHQERMGDDAVIKGRLYAEDEQGSLFGGEP